LEAAAFGMIGLEPALPMLLTLVTRGLLSANRLVEALTSAPARVGKLDAGTLDVGARADVAVIDPALRWTLDVSALRSKSHNTPWLGQEMTGAVVLTLVDGEIVYKRKPSNEVST